MISSFNKIKLIESKNKCEIKIDGVNLKGLQEYQIKRDLYMIDLTLRIHMPVDNFSTEKGEDE